MANLTNASRVKETTDVVGTGTANLLGAVSDFSTFVAAGLGGLDVHYAIVHEGTGEYEIGRGTITDAGPDTLSRTTIFENSAHTQVALSFSAGIKDVFLAPVAERFPTEWVAFTPTGVWTTNATYTGFWRRVGIDSIEVVFTIALTGAPTPAGTIGIDLPSGFTVDTAKRENLIAPYGICVAHDSGVTTRYLGILEVGTSMVPRVWNAMPMTVAGRITATSPFTFASGDTVTGRAIIPVLE